MSSIKITLPDNSVKELETGSSVADLAALIGKRLAQDALAGEVDGKLVDTFFKLEKDAQVRIITWKDPEGVELFRHSTAHILAQAVTALFPDAHPTIGPAVEEGFYYDFDIEHHFTPEDITKIEKKMQEVVDADYHVERLELSVDEAKKTFAKNPYKIELIEEFNEPSSAYQQGNFVDLCRGPHIPRTGMVKAFKIMKVAGAYWRGDAKNKQLQRIYGISFPDKKLLKKHLTLLEEAEKRDHRKLGKELDLFSLHEQGPGFIFFHAKGVRIINTLKEFLRQELDKRDYQEIITPQILSRTLWEQSGHWDHYKENMYFTKVDNKEFAVKPMNCPGAILVYKEKLPSYRDFPLKLSEFGQVHRHELSGVLAGLFRVRAFTQDDAHVYCLPSQIEDQIVQLIELTDYVYKTFGFEYHIELSTRPEKFTGRKETWDQAEKALENALKKKKIDFKLNPGDGAFYGPKIDFHIKDCLGRTWQCATIQVDFQMPEKFALEYVAEDNSRKRPVMIHRAIFGSIERFLGILIEHYAGKFPLWLSPLQARIITVADRFNDYAFDIKKQLQEVGIRVDMDIRTESVSYKVRQAQLEKVPIIINVGEKEEQGKTLAVRTLDGKVKFGLKTNDFVASLKKAVESKSEQFKL